MNIIKFIFKTLLFVTLAIIMAIIVLMSAKTASSLFYMISCLTLFLLWLLLIKKNFLSLDKVNDFNIYVGKKLGKFSFLAPLLIGTSLIIFVLKNDKSFKSPAFLITAISITTLLFVIHSLRKANDQNYKEKINKNYEEQKKKPWSRRKSTLGFFIGFALYYFLVKPILIYLGIE